MAKYIILILLVGLCQQALAVNGRFPTGVNVNTNGATTVVINYFNLAPGEHAVDAFWCGDVTQEGVIAGTNPCVEGTFLGRLPPNLDVARPFGENAPLTGLEPQNAFIQNRSKAPLINNSANPANLQDVMSIPVAVIRRAYQQAQNNQSSEFYYIRKFVVNGIETYVTVTCRMAGGGARSPLALTRVDLGYLQHDNTKGIATVTADKPLSPFQADIRYTGSGILKGRWEVVLPGQAQPTEFDLFPAGSLPVEQRGEQQRYRFISRFQTFLAPTGKTIIDGPDISKLPFDQKGSYTILLRIEASNEKESNIVTEEGVVATGGASGFALPVLRYIVSGERSTASSSINVKPISLNLPLNNQYTANQDQRFSWQSISTQQANIAGYRLEFFDTKSKELINAVILPSTATQYRADLSLLRQASSQVFWRVSALDDAGNSVNQSAVRQLQLR